jgi:hypothetical protein
MTVEQKRAFLTPYLRLDDNTPYWYLRRSQADQISLALQGY